MLYTDVKWYSFILLLCFRFVILPCGIILSREETEAEFIFLMTLITGAVLFHMLIYMLRNNKSFHSIKIYVDILCLAMVANFVFLANMAYLDILNWADLTLIVLFAMLDPIVGSWSTSKSVLQIDLQNKNTFFPYKQMVFYFFIAIFLCYLLTIGDWTPIKYYYLCYAIIGVAYLLFHRMEIVYER